jgi:hypothetical protein
MNCININIHIYKYDKINIIEYTTILFYYGYSYNRMTSRMISESFAKDHVDRWIAAWNNHDVAAVLSLYSEDTETHSPKIKAVFPDRTVAKITNKQDLENYFSLALKKFPNLHFTPIDFIIKGNQIILEYHGTPDGKTRWSVIEKQELKDGLIAKSDVYYGAEDVISKTVE